MANTLQTKKRAKTNITRRSINRGRKTKLKVNTKILIEAWKNNLPLKERSEAFQIWQKTLDRAVSHSVIKKNKASRLKSSFMSKYYRDLHS